MDIKLVSVPEAGYLACNNVGEIWVRGPAVTFGYLNSENSCITAPATMPDGWYRTGDIAQWHPNGQIEIIDRIKNIQKLANGEYVALEKLEAVYKTSVYVANVKIHDLCKEPKIQEHIFDSLLAAAAANGFVRTETVIGCVIDPDGWTPENGFLTAATKLQRARIRQKLAQQIDEVYLKYRLSV
ncbi:long-chain fatty acid-CoA ligase [Linderina macrospora]|uniref:Long-chain fatty acid-CoA ligase n=1 Tax=Linderina macrospora TaxID=4868 RepID=A0ACC1JE18_9FUNG|nr:long-chain fatty acid-CoA ligase [Linderina macrospora]